jgi:hypothetical protein
MPTKRNKASEHQNRNETQVHENGGVLGVEQNGGTLVFSVTPKGAESIEKTKSAAEERAHKFANEVARCTNFLGLDDMMRKLTIAQSLPDEAGSPGARFHMAYMMDGIASDGVADSIVSAIAPRDGVEALLAIQMAAIQSATLKASRRLATAEYMEQLNAHESALNRLARTFTAQVETLRKYRTGGTQTVRHVHVNEGGQAIVADTINNTRIEGGT